MKIGILSDTHNLLRPEVTERLRDCGYILHGGDVSSRGILDQLEKIAPVRAVRGNNDGEWAEYLPASLDFELAGLRIYMTHKKKDLPGDLTPYDLAVYGHSHQYSAVWTEPDGRKRTLLLNPGSCGPRRFIQPITFAVLSVDEDGWNAERIEIPHVRGEAAPETGKDVRRQIEIVIRETQKGRATTETARKYGMDPAFAEQAARLYLTHPGVTADGIMTKMGL